MAIGNQSERDMVSRSGELAQDTFRLLSLLGPNDVPAVRAVLDAMPNGIVMLNKQETITYVNPAMAHLVGKEAPQLQGLLVGNALSCLQVVETGKLCGATEHCSLCGVRQVIRDTVARGIGSREARLLRRVDGRFEALDVRVQAQQLLLGSDSFMLIVFADISHEKRRHILERLFFHDLINMASVIPGFVEMLADMGPDDSGRHAVLATLARVSHRLLDEIRAQQQLAAAEADELVVYPEPAWTRSLLQPLVDLYQRHPVADQRRLVLASASENLFMTVDVALLERVLGNMLKNALEACRPGETVVVGCYGAGSPEAAALLRRLPQRGAALRLDSAVYFAVDNPGEMPAFVQQQLFHRSFSTKGEGRGIGTYSMKLLSERYLHGRIGFASSPEHGTQFIAAIPAHAPMLLPPDTPL